MSGTNPHNESLSYSGQPEQSPVYLLVWDAPNIDMGLGSLLGDARTPCTVPGSTPSAAG